jgi:hypothetical protein
MVTAVNRALYEGFIKSTLSDVAERRTDAGEYLARGERRSMLINGERRRVFVHGDHVCYQDERFQGSDAAFRLTMALTAAELIEHEELGRARSSNKRARLCVAEALLSSGCERLKKHFLQPGRRRITANQADAADKTTRLAATVGREASRYRKEHPEWKRLFDFQMRLFRSEPHHDKDPERFLERELGYEHWLTEFERRTEFEWVEAAPVIAFARLYHKQHKFDQAITIYQKAIEIAHRARMNEEFRGAVLVWFDRELRACQEKIDPFRDPVDQGQPVPIQTPAEIHTR